MEVNSDVYSSALIKLVYDCLDQVSKGGKEFENTVNLLISQRISVKDLMVIEIVVSQDPANRPTAEQVLDQPFISCCRQ